MSSGMKHQMTYFDLVRGISAQLVVLGHATVLAFPAVFAVRGPGGLLGARPDQFHVQSYGVVIFLVLSGYLITMSVRRRRRSADYGFRVYAVDRWARIFTPLLPAMVVVTLVDRLVFRDGRVSQFVAIRHDPVTMVSNVLMLQDNALMRDLARETGLPVAARALGSAAPWWTVGLEWWVYVGFGVVSLVVLRRPTPGRWLVALPLLLVAVWSLVVPMRQGQFLMLAWLMGFAYAWWPEAMTRVPRWLHASLALVACLALWAAFDVLGLTVYDPLVAVMTGVAVLSGFHAAPWGRLIGAARRPIAFVSDYSYSLYLIHFSVMTWVVVLLPATVTGTARYVVLVLAGNLAGILWWWAFERHFGQVRDAMRRLVTRPSSPRRPR